jgi:hypothetical protein
MDKTYCPFETDENILMWFGAELLELSDKDLGPTATNANQYILGAKPVLYDGYFPGENAWNIQFDYGLVVLPIPEGGLETGNGFPVDLTGIEPVTLISILDIPEALEFVNCALEDPNPAGCGCIEVDKHGMCP